jgi:ABC-type lipoprotein export system ATPase subunit
MADVVFAARGLTKTNRDGEIEVHVLAGVDLDLFADGLVVLLGPSGKSTLLNILGWIGSRGQRARQVSQRGSRRARR